MGFIQPTNHCCSRKPPIYHVIDEKLDAIDTIRQRTTSADMDDDPFYICDMSDIIRKHHIWQQLMPRIFPFYGKFTSESS